MASGSNLTDGELELLRASQADRSRLVTVTVIGCAYSCCGRGWMRKDGYEQTYTGYVDNLKLPYIDLAGTFMLYSAGLGGLSYVIACRFFEVASVERRTA